MSKLWKNKIIFWHLVALIFIKAVFSYSSLQFANLLDGVKIFDKEEVVSQTNFFRKNLGLGELKSSYALETAAAQKLNDMAQNNYFAHTSPSGVSPWHWIEVNQYKYSYAGENLAIGFFSAKDTVDAWINSPTHKANITNGNYKEIGVAVAPVKIQNTEGILVVQLFGSPRPTIVATNPITKPAPTKPSTTIIPTPSSKPQLKPAATQIPPITLKYLGDESQEISKPVVSNINAQPSSEVTNLGSILNTSLVLYALIAFMVSVVLLLFKELNKGLVIRTAASLTLLILAIAIPVLQVSRTALIF